ncbi:MAG TPA: L-threonylcarbamoyladenylate synthase [Vicinamibacterales bacterium]|jgi:L-threonylcarbamoyladenylate synthase|nr:L-threonylcarbamoyladenylate synthase [Vicinamibacterales bacterium]
MPVMLRVDPRNPEAAAIREAAQMIRDGLVVAYPTDTLYGLAVDPRNPAAVIRLYALKGRADTSALTLIAADLAQVRQAAEMSGHALRLAGAWWPGPLTIVLRAKAAVARETLSGGDTVGVRVPDHAVAVALARAAGFCITATSANRSGAAAASAPGAVRDALPDVDAIVDAGASPGGAASTIVSAAAHDVTLVRAGAIAWERVLRSLS